MIFPLKRYFSWFFDIIEQLIFWQLVVHLLTTKSDFWNLSSICKLKLMPSIIFFLFNINYHFTNNIFYQLWSINRLFFEFFLKTILIFLLSCYFVAFVKMISNLMHIMTWLKVGWNILDDIYYSSGILYLCLMKCAIEMFQNLP